MSDSYNFVNHDDNGNTEKDDENENRNAGYDSGEFVENVDF